jgi:UDP-hydrolysing UDP-N-acetyl-D-glucosamine 2-epimerase
MPYKITYFLSNRASYYRSKPVLDLLLRDLDIELNVMITSSLTYQCFEDVKNEIVRRYTRVSIIPFNGYDGSLYGMAFSSSRLSQSIAQFLDSNKPDFAVCFADRFELLPFAMACSYMRIPLAQIQAGEDSGNIDQKVRHAVSHLSDMTFASHKPALQRLTMMGVSNCYNTGCPSIDVITKYDINRYHSDEDYIICMFHPHSKESHSADIQIEIVLKHVDLFCQETGFKCYYFASNNDPGHLSIKRIYESNSQVSIIQNMAEKNYLRLLAGAKAIVGNSSSGLREASYLGVSAVNIGSRQENRVKARNVIQSSFSGIYDNIHKAVKKEPKPSKLFGDGRASERIVERIKQWLSQNKKN